VSLETAPPMETAMSISSSTTHAAPRSVPRLSSVRDLLTWIAMLWQTHRDRRELAMLSDAMLADIGLTRADVERELARPIWNGIDYAALEATRERCARRTARGSRPR
jgi:uncharacterized protein YjiS (DUF1127 family)